MLVKTRRIIEILFLLLQTSITKGVTELAIPSRFIQNMRTATDDEVKS